MMLKDNKQPDEFMNGVIASACGLWSMVGIITII
jgi:hypothetical protein